VREIDFLIVILLIIVIILLVNINLKLPKRDYTQEMIEKALVRDRKEKHTENKAP